MSYKILEQNGIDNENIDGGAFNNFAASGRDGIVGGVLSECTITATGSVVAIAPGLLMIHGIRVKIEEIETIAIMSVPLRPTSYQLVGQVIVSSKNNVEFSAFIRSPQELAQSNFYTSGEGTYQVELASFVHNPDGSISDLVRTVDIIYGGAGGGTNIEVGNVVTETLPAETDAEFDVTVRNPAGTNKTLLDFTAKIPKGASGTDEGAVHFNEVQSLSEQQKAQARENIDAASTSGMHPKMTVGAATKATQDGSGNNIVETYQPKVEGVDITPCSIELGLQNGTPSNAYIDFHTDGKSGDETDYNARIVAYVDFPKDLAVQVLDGGSFRVPSYQSFVPNGDSSEKATPTEFLQPGMVYDSGYNYGYRGKNYSINMSTYFTAEDVKVMRSGNVVIVSGWARLTRSLVAGTGYLVMSGLPTVVGGSYGEFIFATGTVGVSAGRVWMQGNSLYMATNISESNPQNSWLMSFSLVYVTNE